ncbi:MAG: DUF2892 domain-containing protein [Chloroflexi bacterium SZAS-1]|jgi:hypothetical protein|nr:DUF2892 domain-containing protein [Chloroflexi bacterium SZAS-1]HNP85374.1 DUF2892 domain-containing protein [Kouleothrix sp.]
MLSLNEGSLDRGIRIVVGLVLFALVFTLTGIWQIIAGIAGLLMLATGAIGFCPLYRIFGISTRPRSPATRR